MSEGNTNGPVVMRKVIETFDLGKSARQWKSRLPQPGAAPTISQTSQQTASPPQASQAKNP